MQPIVAQNVDLNPPSGSGQPLEVVLQSIGVDGTEGNPITVIAEAHPMDRAAAASATLVGGTTPIPAGVLPARYMLPAASAQKFTPIDSARDAMLSDLVDMPAANAQEILVGTDILPIPVPMPTAENEDASSNGLEFFRESPTEADMGRRIEVFKAGVSQWFQGVFMGIEEGHDNGADEGDYSVLYDERPNDEFWEPLDRITYRWIGCVLQSCDEHTLRNGWIFDRAVGEI